MDQGPVGAGWRLAPEIAQETQGLVVTGFSSLPTGRALLLTLAPQTDQAWLADLLAVAPITSATPPAEKGEVTRAAALAFTASGLARMGLSAASLASFLPAFQEGMMQEDRLRRLGDRRKGQWCDTVADPVNGPVWSGNSPLSGPAPAPVKAYEVQRAAVEDRIETALTIHALLLLYTSDTASAEAWTQRVAETLSPHGVQILRQLALDLGREAGQIREHFGFADGLSQPRPHDAQGAVLRGGLPVTQPDRVQGIPLGEVLLGYVNGHREIPPGPVVPGEPETRARQAGLAPHPQAQGFYDFGRNGSYLVVRELKQDVAAFWRSMDRNAADLRAADPAHSDHVTADWLAERVVGRSRDGHLLCPGGQLLPPARDGSPDNDFLFLARDGRGLGCPLGSHVRRSNPRDTLAPRPAEGPTLLSAANNHRILRRGRKYGPKISDPRVDDGQDRGLLFMALNTDIARQFEFIQQTWLLNANFATLFQEVDPLVGPAGPMTVPEDPLRRTLQVETFVKLSGGEYFFLPSLPALRYLAQT